ncbi:MFS transporter [Gracilibacillus sp. Marseille-QA3620]
MAGSFFGPSSTYYITKYIPVEERQRFNAILGTFNAGFFLLGPALAGLIIFFYNTDMAIWLNSLSFFICALIISRLPKVGDDESGKGALFRLQPYEMTLWGWGGF